MTTPEERIKAAAEAIDKATAPVLVNSGFVAQQALAAAYPEGCGRGGAMTTPEERIQAATKALRESSIPELSLLAEEAVDVLAPILTADFPPKPKWPSDESVARFKAAYRSSTNSNIPMPDEWVRDCLREAMTPDPIIKEAVAHRSRLGSLRYHGLTDPNCPVCRAVDEAGL